MQSFTEEKQLQFGPNRFYAKLDGRRFSNYRNVVRKESSNFSIKVHRRSFTSYVSRVGGFATGALAVMGTTHHL